MSFFSNQISYLLILLFVVLLIPLIYQMMSVKINQPTTKPNPTKESYTNLGDIISDYPPEKIQNQKFHSKFHQNPKT